MGQLQNIAHTHTPIHMEAAMGHAICGGLSDAAYLVLFKYRQAMLPDVCVCVQQGHAGQRQGYPTNILCMCMANAIAWLQQADSRLQKPLQGGSVLWPRNPSTLDL